MRVFGNGEPLRSLEWFAADARHTGGSHRADRVGPKPMGYASQGESNHSSIGEGIAQRLPADLRANLSKDRAQLGTLPQEASQECGSLFVR